MPKIDPVWFGTLMSRITSLASSDIYHGTASDIYDLVGRCYVEPPSQPAPILNPSLTELNRLMMAFSNMKAENASHHKIEAIKAYRSLTGYGLKEAKEAVESCWHN